jgi:hypothetical protein
MLILVLITVLLNAVAYSFHLAGWHATCDGGSMPTPAERSDTTGFEA